MATHYKVDGNGNKWHVWRWGVQGEFWSIVSNAYLTKRAATAAMKREANLVNKTRSGSNTNK